MTDKQSIQKRIRFLQRSLVQISFGTIKDRPKLYKSLLKSLNKAQKLLIENKSTQRGF